MPNFETFLVLLLFDPPCAVAPNKWVNSYVGEYCMVEVGEGSGVWDTSCPNHGILARLPKEDWRGDVI